MRCRPTRPKWGCDVRRGSLKVLTAVLGVVALLAIAGCQPSVTSQLEAGLPPEAARPTTMPNEVGRDADKAGTELLDAHVPVRVVVPARSIAASRTIKGGHITAATIEPTSVELKQSNRRYIGFKVVSQDPPAGVALAASQTVVLTVGAHPGAVAGTTWYSTHLADVYLKGKMSCYDTTAGGQTGCHVPSYCAACHYKIINL